MKMNLERELECLEDHDLNTKLSRGAQYRNVLNILVDEHPDLCFTTLERLLAVCVHDLQDDVTIAVHVLTVLATVLKKIKTEDLKSTPDLLPSVLKIVNCISATVSANANADSFATICVDTLLLYPDEVLVKLITLHPDEICNIFNLLGHYKFSVETRLKPLTFLSKLLTILPADVKIKYIKDSLKIWFLKVIPAIMNYYISKSLVSLEPVEVLEKLTDELVHIEYSDDQSWKSTFDCIWNPKKYPLSMKSLLEEGSDVWHRLWMVFIRLLKHLTTKSNQNSGSPINSLLPVVDTAFKMDVDNRCRAFQCWKVLIDNFSTETNEVYIVKRIKLLIIPLNSNNAKVEETALAKLDTWWHLIAKFERRLDKFADAILIPFLNFCFGKVNPQQGMVPVVPGLMTDNLKRKCVEALIELVGHSRNCHGCVSILRLERKVLSTHLLVNYWNNWMYACQIAISISTDIYNESTAAQITCLWKSLISTISELPENNVRKDLFIEVLSMIDKLLMNCNTHMRDIIYNALIEPIIAGRKFRTLLVSKESSTISPLLKIVCLVTNNAFDNNVGRDNLNKIFKLVVDAALDSNCGSPNYELQVILKNLPANDKTLMFWTVMAKSINESKLDFWPHNFINMLKWPLKSIKSFTNVELAAMPWYEMYSFVYLKLNSILYREICEILFANEIPSVGVNLLMSASLAVLKHEIIHKPEKQCNKEVEYLLRVLNSIELDPNLDKLYPVMIDTLNLMLSKCKNSTARLSEQMEFSQAAILCAKCVVKMLRQKPNSTNNIVFIGKIKKELIDLRLLQKYANLKPLIQQALAECSTLNNNNKETPTEMVCTKTNISTTVKNICQPAEQKTAFSAPDISSLKKSSKKKEANIVNTVVENGEEFVVVKSNWKFNPRKLTENQKEKLQRKREIPALYQDLSQSQDEFKLTTWKTDSQDTSISSKSNSKTMDNNDVSIILNKLPSIEIVPNIMGNILSQNINNQDNLVTDISSKCENSKTAVIVDKELEILPYNINMKKVVTENNEVEDKLKTGSPTQPTQHSTAKKDPKASRMPLKDRVHRNVKMLIENNTIEKDVSDSLSQTIGLNENITKTPPPAKKVTTKNLVNSAPPMLSADRPSRVKRKPKKFDNTELFSMKRKRNSNSLNSQSECDNSETPIPQYNDVSVNQEEVNKIHDNLVAEVNKNVLVSNEISKTGEMEAKIHDFHDKKDDGKENEEIIDSESPEENLNCVHHVQTKEKLKIKTNNENKCELTNNITELRDKVDIDVNNKTIMEAEVKVAGTLVESLLPTTPKASPKKTETEKSTYKKNTVKKSRIEKELAIDMVEGHPYLQAQSQKRTRRKNITEAGNTTKRKNVIEKLNKSKSNESCNKKSKDKQKKPDCQELSDNRSQMDLSVSLVDQQFSEDVIESSQDSSITTISAKSTRSVTKKIPEIRLIKSYIAPESLLDKTDVICGIPSNQENNSVLPPNKTLSEDNVLDLTENMDTEPMDNSDVTFVLQFKRNPEPPITIKPDSSTNMSPETQEIAEADTETMDLNAFLKKPAEAYSTPDISMDIQTQEPEKSTGNIHSKTASDPTITITESLDIEMTSHNANTGECSPFKDDDQRKQDFLNNTLEISPIKTLSPVRHKKSPSPDTSSDYVVIQLSSPVQSNGEPFDKCDSPEVFTEDKVSPDKRDQSPPRAETSVNNTSPSSSLSLKKNRPQVRSGGRAAQMLGLCGANDKLQTIKAVEELKRGSPVTPAKKNLRILYNSAGDNDQDNSEQSENFLKFKKVLPTVDCSPSGPILKRKLVDIVDEETVSPVSKRKRVSFHDPPVSTTISVHKYIEPIGLRSPQNSVHKRLERQMRAQTTTKSSKKLENAFKLDTVLHKAIESFSENDTINSTDNTPMSLDQTPAVEVIQTSELNDTDPICQDLIECQDPLDNIASELSSPTMKVLLIKELVGKVETVGDLAKLTELEVNRLCIKAPKIQVAKKVLADYAKRTVMSNETAIEMQLNIDMTTTTGVDTESQTIDIVMSDVGMQCVVPVTPVSTQTERVILADRSAQTMESGSKSTRDIVKSMMLERQDFIENLCNILDDASRQKIAESLPLDAITDMMMNKTTPKEGSAQLNRILNNHDRFDSKDLFLFCIQLLQKIHDNTH